MSPATSLGPAGARPRSAFGAQPNRPLLWVAAALAAGSAAGAWGWGSSKAWGEAAAILCTGWIAWRLAEARFASPEGRVGGVPRSGKGWPGALALIVCVGALRAASPPIADWSPSITAWEGQWSVRRTGESEVSGTLEPGPAAGSGARRFELPSGAALHGERVRILRGAPPPLAARGPLPITGRARDTVSPQRAPVGAGPWPEPSEHPIPVAADEVLRLRGVEPEPGWPARWREHLDRRAAQLADPRAGALAQAFLLGDSRALDPEVADLFTRNGLRHVLAVSGWHVAMMALWIVRPFATLARVLVARWPRRQQVLCWITMSISVILCLAYAPLTGGGAPVRRAAVAVALAATVSVSGRAPNGVSRRIDALTLWAAALVFECWLDPGAVCEVSVQLSYGATLGLILGTRPVTACLTRSLGVHLETAPRELLHGPWRACLAAWRRRAVRAGITGVAASLSAVCATAPVIWWTFGEACPWGVLTTPLLAPLFVLLFVSGMLMLLTPWAPLEVLFTGTGEALMEAMSFVDSLPGTPMLLPERPGWLVCGAVGLGWWVVGRARPGLETGSSAATGVPGRWPRLGALPRAASLASAAALALPWSGAPADFELHALAVGHGTAVVFRGPGEPGWIFDCGSRDRPRPAQDALRPLLRAWELDRPVVVLSHGDRDHSGGLAWLLERTRPRGWIGALPAQWGERLPHTSGHLDVGIGLLELPERLPDATLTLLRGLAEEGNEGSRSLLVEVRGTALLLCGDAVDAGWPQVLRERLAAAPGGLLLAPHHGSQGPRLGGLLDAAAPSQVWVSAAATPGIAAELDRRRIPWKLTAREGPLAWTPEGTAGAPAGTPPEHRR